MVESAITRRKFMQLAAGAAASLLLGSCNRPLFSDSPAIITPRAAEFTGEFSFYAAQYIPTSARGMGEPVREAMKTLADKWVDLHPEVEFSFILEPPRMTFETWISTQILMGTGPDTFLTSLPFLNSLAANRGSVVLNDYLDSPNPYHKEAERWGASFSDSYFKQTGSHGVLCGVPIDRNATGLETGRGDQQAGARHFGQPAIAERSQPVAQFDQCVGGRVVGLPFPFDDRRLPLGRRKIEIERNEALPCARLQVLEHPLVARVVRNDEQETGRCLDRLAGLVDRQHPSVIGQRVQNDDRVLARLDHFVEIADRSFAHRPGQRAVLPHGFVVADQEAADQVARGQVVMAGHRDQRPPQAPGHVLDEARLAAAGRALEQDRQARGIGGLEDLDLVADGEVPGLVEQPAGGHGVVHSGMPGASGLRFSKDHFSSAATR